MGSQHGTRGRLGLGREHAGAARGVRQVGLLDEEFPLYGEELDLATRMQAAGWKVLFTPEVEILHEGGVSTGRSRRAR